MGTLEAIGIAAIGVLVAEMLEAYGLYLRGEGSGATHRWPASPTLRQYALASAIRLVLGGVVALALSVAGLMCAEGVALLAGLSTLKAVEILLGYTPAASGGTMA